MTAYKPLKTGY